MNDYVTTKNARRILGVSEESLRSWADKGLINCIRTPGGQRLYAINSFIQSHTSTIDEQHTELKRICYCRVSSQGQKDDLERQVKHMRDQFPTHSIITDIGSGINFKRKGLRTILELAMSGAISEVVVAYRDRLCRFAFELVEWILQFHKVKLVVLNQTLDAETSDRSELAEDLLAIINVFNCRINGKRKYKKKAN